MLQKCDLGDLLEFSEILVVDGASLLPPFGFTSTRLEPASEPSELTSTVLEHKRFN